MNKLLDVYAEMNQIIGATEEFIKISPEPQPLVEEKLATIKQRAEMLKDLILQMQHKE